MRDLHNIDKLLKDSFADFSPEAPDVWQGVQQGVQAAQAGQAAGAAVAVKGTGLITKIIAIIAISASAVTGYVMLQDDKPAVQPTVEKESPVVSQEVAAPEVAENVNAEEPVLRSFTEPSQMVKVIPETHKHAEAAKAAERLPQTDQRVIQEQTATQQPQQEIRHEENSTVPTTPGIVNRETVKKETQENNQPKQNNAQADSKKTQQREEEFQPTIPGSFTPNGDGINDYYRILIENEQFYSLVIQDKNGNTVFESTDKDTVWDGNHYKSGATCPGGSYYCILRYQLKGADSERKITRIIQLID